MAKLPIREFETEVRTRLRALGFAGRVVFTLRLDDVRSGWLGVSRGTRGMISIFPNVGVIHRGIAELAWRGQELPPSPAPILMTSLTALVPLARHSGWQIATVDEIPRVMSDVIDALMTAGIPYMKRFVTVDDFICELRESKGAHRNDYNLPAALFLNGRRDEATVELRRGLDLRVGRTDVEADNYRRFCESLVPGTAPSPDAGPISPFPNVGIVIATSDRIAAELERYGEARVATLVRQLSGDQLFAIHTRAFEHATKPAGDSARGMLLAKALALAAVEVLEGHPRPLARSSRSRRSGSE